MVCLCTDSYKDEGAHDCMGYKSYLWELNWHSVGRFENVWYHHNRTYAHARNMLESLTSKLPKVHTIQYATIYGIVYTIPVL